MKSVFRKLFSTVVTLLMPLTLACNDGTKVDNFDDTMTFEMTCNDGLIEVAHDVYSRYPTWRDAKRGESLNVGYEYKEAHQEKEIEGFGITLVTIKGIAGVKNWNGDLRDPSILLFEKDESLNKDDWPLIGFGYHHEWDDDTGMGACNRPSPLFNNCIGFEDFEQNFIIHEAGYHKHAFQIATSNNIKNGRGSLDAAGCNLIDKNDVKTKYTTTKHGRAWTMHVFLHPETQAPIISTVDPWNRDGGDGWEYSTPPGSFYAQGECNCLPESVQPLNPTVASPTLYFLDESEISSLANFNDVDERNIRVFPDVDSNYRVTMLSWLNPLEQLGILPEDEVELIHFVDELRIIRLSNSYALEDALDLISNLQAGDHFQIFRRRNGVMAGIDYYVQ